MTFCQQAQNEERARGKRPTPAPHDERSQCLQGRCLDQTSKERFPSTERMSQAIKDGWFDPQQCCARLDEAATALSRRFGALNPVPHGERSWKANQGTVTFWGAARSFPTLLTACALRASASFGSFYPPEMVFSQMKIIKSKFRSCLAGRQLTESVAVCSCELQSQPSHWLQSHDGYSSAFWWRREKWCCRGWDRNAA